MNNENISDQQYVGDKFPPPQPPLSNQRVVHQIPVQHLNSEPINNTDSLPSSHNFLNDRYRNNNYRDNSPFNRRQDLFNSNFFNRPIFDRYDTDFDAPFETSFNKRTEPDSRFITSRLDDLFRPERFNNNTPKDFYSPTINQDRSQSQTRNTPPSDEKQEDRSKKEPSPIPVIHNSNPERSTDSPKRFTTQTTIFPNQTSSQPVNQKQNSPIPIKIEHLQPTNNFKQQSDFKYTDSDFGQQRQSSPTETSKMGSTMSNAPGKHQQPKSNSNDFTKQSNSPLGAKQPEPKTLPKQQQQQQQQQTTATAAAPKTVKTPQEKCDDIKVELESLEKRIDSFNGKKNEREYLLIEEFLTRCMLKLDEIEKGEDSFNQFRKSLINYAHKLSDKLESKCNSSKTDEESCPSEAKISKMPDENDSQVSVETKPVVNTEQVQDSNLVKETNQNESQLGENKLV